MTFSSPTDKVKLWLSAPLPPDVARSVERLAGADDVCHVAVMPDVHLARDVCIGIAMATRERIYPSAVGSDIGCGMAALQFDADAHLLDDEKAAAHLLTQFYRNIPSLKHSGRTLPESLPPDLSNHSLSHSRLERLKDRDGRFQLGTLGRGNHFVELQADDQDRLWLMVHSGSRGMGQAITNHHVERADNPQPSQKLLSFDAHSANGQDYLTDVAWAIRYAEYNRMAIVTAVEAILFDLFKVEALHQSLIHANHNHVQPELHLNQTLFVHRKGALPADLQEPGLIPGSMGTASFHVVGRGVANALCSSSHGAGRTLSRSEALKQIDTRRIGHEMRGIWFDHRRANRLRDEAPSAYKDINSVMRAQRELTKITRRLRPLLNFKGA